MLGRMPRIVIIDYGVGNLLSVRRAVEKCGGEAVTSPDPAIIAQADGVILPGVGAFASGMEALDSLALIPVIQEVAASGTPLLGICLGMQLLLEESEEHGLTEGLGIMPGRVTRIPSIALDGTPIKIPHIGWSKLIGSDGGAWDNTILEKSSPEGAMYFVHSFMAEPRDSTMRLADCEYGGMRLAAVIKRKNIYGCQFHPEKSGEAGLNIIKKFLSISAKVKS